MPDNTPANRAACSIGTLGARVTRFVAAGITLVTAAAMAQPAHAQQQFHAQIDGPASTLNYTLSVNAPFAGTTDLAPGAAIPTTSYLIGKGPGFTPPTRTRPGTGFGTFTGNNPVAINSGTLTLAANNGSTPLRPSGTMLVQLRPEFNAVVIDAVALDLLGGTTTSATPTLTLRYQTFRTNDPNSFLPLPGTQVSPPMSPITVSALTAAQATPNACGSLTPAANGAFTFSASVDVIITTQATMSGSPLAIDPTPATLVLTGTIAPAPAGFTITARATLDQTQVTPGPTALSPVDFTDPIYGGLLQAFVVLASTTTSVSMTADTVARSTDVFNWRDYNRDLFVNLDDLGDFITDFYTRPNPVPSTNFNCDAFINLDDLGDYITYFYGW
jgi:hypothetical protein